MKRALVTLVVATMVVAVWSTPASANGGPHRGSYALVTPVCSACHRAQTPGGTYPLKADTVYALCVSCHGGLVATDVVRGVLQGATDVDGVTPRKLNGGGFVQQNGGPVTSRHRVKGVPVVGTPFAGTVVAYGSQNGDGVPASDAGVGVSGVLELHELSQSAWQHELPDIEGRLDHDPMGRRRSGPSRLRFIPGARHAR